MRVHIPESGDEELPASVDALCALKLTIPGGDRDDGAIADGHRLAGDGAAVDRVDHGHTGNRDDLRRLRA